jgi:hypothetical protein
MAKSRGLTHQIARLLLLAFCVSLLIAISSSFIPQPALARTSHIVQGPGDLGGALESKPDQWGAPERQLLPMLHQSPGMIDSGVPLFRTILLVFAHLLVGWI